MKLWQESWRIGTQLLALVLLTTCSPGIYLEECENGVIVDGVCQPASCAGRQCPAGFYCDDGSGQCIEVTCAVVECPAGQACADGRCYPKDCQTRTCPGVGDVCIDEECQPASCVGVDCAANERCAGGQCYPVDCPTKVCPGQLEVCVDEECVEQSCVGVTCPAGERCAAGNCYPAGCGDTGCFGEGEVCIDGVCQRTSCVDVECPAGQACANGWCYPADCAGVDCSDFGEVCYQDQCVHADCVGIQCPAGEQCARGQCFPLNCGQVNCQPPYVCVDGNCVRSNCVGVQCPPGQTCADGECLARDCNQVGCAAGEVCVDNTCVPDDCAHVSCPAGEICGADLQCHPADCAGNPCGEYEVCVNDTCVDRLCLDVTCNAGEICLAGRCYDPLDPSCQPACGAGEVCEDGHCIPEQCANWRCCPPFDCTEQNQCEQYTCDEGVVFTCLHDGAQPVWSDSGTQCTDLDPCTINDTCQPDGSCQGGPMPCDQDEVCVNGVCQCGGVGPDCTGNETCCTYDNNCYDLDSDLDNCGACNAPCRRDHATPACVGGVCQIGSCDALWDDCNGVDADGCETSLETLTDCASCGTPCSAPVGATVSCAGGSCHITNCDPLLGDCDGVVSNGCEQSLEDLAHCNACNTPCSRANATAQCPGGNCQILACNAGFGDCDGQDPNGCENTLDSLTDCGACGVACSRANATADCSGDVCHIGTCDPLWDDCNSTDSDGCETSLETLTDCGSCGTPCSAPGATTTCTGGTCRIANCDPLLGDCDGNLLNGCEQSLEDLAHCNACNTPCSRANASAQCPNGNCQILACNAGFGDCDGQDANGCENTLDSLTDCGACGVACSRANATADCSGDVCHIGTCNPLWDDCNSTDSDGCETSLETNTDCGSCGTPCSAPGATTTCTGGTCRIANCDPLLGDCDGNLLNGCEQSLDTLQHCNACNTPCSRANASAQCPGGNCQILACNALWDDCNGVDADGCETSLETLTDCGSCGTPCSRANATADCTGGSCTIGACLPLWDDCNGQDPDGCETSLETLTDCGSCGTPCSRANATADCTGGSCSIASCLPLFGDCNGQDPDGCETPLTTLSDCGSCGQPCSLPNATAECSTGTCLIQTCNSGFGDCDGQDSNGCENTLDSLTDCGACGVTCSRANATADCSGDVCHIGSCNPLFDNCNGVDSDGCETSLETLSDCGSCGTPCTRANANADCTGGSCSIGSCLSGWGDCDGIDANGCENSLDSLSDCGSCGTPCSRTNATADCSGDVCHIGSCNAGYDNCNGVDADGCEVNLNNDDANCGSCGFACNQNASCSGGNCTCSTNYANCDGSWANGCEVDLLTDPANCGGCGNSCGANATCSGGGCVCLANYANCDGNWTNGCEVNLLTDPNNCGGCGNSCGANAFCSGGSCACNSLWGNCDSNWGNGCETALTSLTNCGGCGVPCDLPNANDTCASGSCEIASCWANYGNCDGNDANGCEQLLNTLTHCGACNNPCNLPNATETCSSFTCQISSCNSGYWNIDNITSNGCECGDTSDSPDTCGSATNLGTISGSQSVQRSGVIAHRTGYRADVDCFRVTHTASNPAVGGGRMTVTVSGGNLDFNVWKGNCSTSDCTNDTQYVTQCASAGPTCESDNSGTYYVCVDVQNAGTATCSSYTITFQSAP